MLKKLFIFIFASSLFACEFQSDKQWVVDIPKPANGTVVFEQFNLNADTLWSFPNRDFSVSIKDTKIETIEAFIDGKSNGDPNLNGMFFIPNTTTPYETHELKLVIKATLNSKIIDNQYESERVTIEKKCVLAIVNFNFPQGRSIKFSNENGFLKLVWPKYNSKDFISYIITGWNSSGKSFVDSTKNEFYFDKTYFGDYARYEIIVKSKTGISIYFGVTDFSAKAFGAAHLIQFPDKSFGLTFPPFAYPNNIERLEVHQDIPNSYKYFNVTNFKQVNDSTIQLPDLKFGQYAKINIIFVPKVPPPNFNDLKEQFYNAIFYAYIGQKGPEMTSFIPFSKNQYLSNNYLYNYFPLMVMSEDQKMVSELPLEMQNSSPILSASCKTFAFAKYQNRLFTGKTQDFNSCKETPLPIDYYINIQTISDVGLMAIINSYTISFFDLESQSELFKIPVGNDYTNTVISADAQYFIIKDEELKLYSIKEKLPVLIWNSGYFMRNKYSLYYFKSDDSNQIFLWDGKNIIWKRAQDFVTVSSFAVDVDGVHYIDKMNNRMLARKNGNLIVINTLNGEIIANIPSQINLSEPYYLLNKTIFYPALKLKYTIN